jgi:anti-sigma factor RsiW
MGMKEVNVSDCHGIRAKLGRFIDAELTPADQGAIQSHIEACPDCRQELNGLKRLSASLDDLAVPPVPERLVAGVMARIREDVPVGTPWGICWFWREWSTGMRMAGCATATIACIAGVLLSSAMSAQRGRTDADMSWLAVASGAPIAYVYGDSSR